MTGQTMPGEHSGKMFEVLYERSPIGMALLRPDGTFVRCNSAFQRITGYTLDELACMSEAALSAPGRDHVAKREDKRKAWEDLVWALINTREFLFRH